MGSSPITRTNPSDFVTRARQRVPRDALLLRQVNNGGLASYRPSSGADVEHPDIANYAFLDCHQGQLDVR